MLLVSLGVLWLFDQTGEAPLHEIISTTIVLAFPGALGAAAARVVL